ncbi:Dabb family protein [Luteolibacter flavescens]|uniref:Dabb family protein n=1 Tax=Luteolibacter flavescens TaxID=1859460 RepID=A0ABT3FLV9_9BACT|nr:Dabb family protein [Luteolibacter flavescens]MCW1884179.1 Dabb family protein [Luteolibacter flavescens]
MNHKSRRQFIAGSALLGISAATATAAETAPAAAGGEKKNDALPKLLHHVFFWLKNPESEEDRAKLIAGIKKLGAIKTVRAIHVGVPASTEKRDVVESSYHVSELLCFDDVEGQNAYQVDPLHVKFVEECSGLWSKVVVYDVLAA